MLIPIRTETPIRRTPYVNVAIIALNMVVFALLNMKFTGQAAWEFAQTHLVFQSDEPALYQFITYQFLHGDGWHLFGNMLALWVFGNSVNAKMGHLPYLMFYLTGGVFAAWGYAWADSHYFRLVGASGAIASITTAYLALFPRSRVTVLFVFFFITFFELPATIIIGLKIIVWDNIIAPGIAGPNNVAHGAHVAGYLIGFVGAMGMLLIRALPRDQFDMIALWKRLRQRRAFAAAMRDPANAARARYGPVARVGPVDPRNQVLEEQQLDEVSAIRGQISERLDQGDTEAAANLYEQLVTKDPQQCLSERQQVAVARTFYGSGRFPQAAAAFDRFLTCYPRSTQASEIRLLVGIVYARDLRQFEAADKRLTEARQGLTDSSRREQCLRWLRDVRAALGRAAPEED